MHFGKLYLRLRAARVPGAPCGRAGEEQVQGQQRDQQQAPGGGLQVDTSAGPRPHRGYTWRQGSNRIKKSQGLILLKQFSHFYDFMMIINSKKEV